MTPRYNEFEPDARYRRDLAEVARQEAWKASRGKFGRIVEFGTFSVTKGNQSTWQLETSSSQDLVRVKRVQLKVMVLKGTGQGWFGFYREASGMEVVSAGLHWDEPAVLRPQLILANPDHATYWDAYLPAVNLADTGVLRGVLTCDSGSDGPSLSGTWAARWVEERGIE